MPGVKGRSGGHNAKTVEEHKLAGTFQKSRHAGITNPDAPRGTPKPQKRLKGDAKREWVRMLVLLEQARTLTTIDGPALYQYCRLFAETETLAASAESVDGTLATFEKALERPEVSGDQIVAIVQEMTKLRQLQVGSLTRVRTNRMACRAYLVEFGMTPASRGRVKVADKPPDDDPFADLDEEDAVN